MLFLAGQRKDFFIGRVQLAVGFFIFACRALVQLHLRFGFFAIVCQRSGRHQQRKTQ